MKKVKTMACENSMQIWPRKNKTKLGRKKVHARFQPQKFGLVGTARQNGRTKKKQFYKLGPFHWSCGNTSMVLGLKKSMLGLT